MASNAPKSPFSWAAAVLREKLGGEGVGARLAHGSGASFAVRLLGVMSGMIGRLALANLLGAAAFGTYYYVFSWVTILSLLATLGLHVASTRYVAEYAAGGRWGELKGFLRRSSRWATASATGVALLGALSLTVPAFPVANELRYAAFVGAVLLVFQSTLQVCSWQLQGFKRVVAAQLPSLVVRPLLVAGAVAVLTLGLGLRLGGAEALGITVVATIVALVVSLRLLGHATPHSVRVADPVYRDSQWLRTALTLLIVTGAHQLLSRTDVLVLGWMLGTTEAGFYGVATELAQQVTFGLTAVNVIAAPMISELYSQSRIRELRRLLLLAAGVTTMFGVLFFVVFALFGSWILRWFGDGFEAAAIALTILAGGYLVNASAGAIGYSLPMCGRQAVAVRILLVALVLNLLLNLLLIPIWGIVGAAIATAVTTTLWNLEMSYSAWRLVLRIRQATPKRGTEDPS